MLSILIFYTDLISYFNFKNFVFTPFYHLIRAFCYSLIQLLTSAFTTEFLDSFQRFYIYLKVLIKSIMFCFCKPKNFSFTLTKTLNLVRVCLLRKTDTKLSAFVYIFHTKQKSKWNPLSYRNRSGISETKFVRTLNRTLSIVKLK